MISGSALDRIAACPASEALPHDDRESPWGNRGTAIHEFLADVSEVGRDKALENVDAEFHDVCADIDVAALPADDPNSYAAEVAFAYDPDTDEARELGRGMARDYSGIRDGEIAGTADVIALADKGRRVCVLDYKSGWGYIPRAAVNRQMRFYALCAARTWGAKAATVSVIRVKPGEKLWIDTASFDEAELGVIAGELVALLDRVAEVKALPLESREHRTGLHCRYCPGYSHCPANIRLAANLGGEPDAVAGELLAELTPASAGRAWERLKVAKRLLDHAEESIKLYACHQPFHLPTDEILGPVEEERESIDGSTAVGILKELFSEEVANAACKVHATKTSLHDALRPEAKRRGKTLKSLKEQALRALRKAGATSTKKTELVKEYRPKKGNT